MPSDHFMFVIALTTGQFAVVYGASGQKFAIYNNDGTQAVAPTSLTGGAGAASCSPATSTNVKALAAGAWAIVYDVSGVKYFQIRSATGSSIKAETALASSPGSGYGYWGMLACANGDFCISATSGGAPLRIWRYTSTGTLVGNVVLSTGAGNGSFNGFAPNGGMAELAGGSIVVSYPNANSGTHIGVALLNAVCTS